MTSSILRLRHFSDFSPRQSFTFCVHQGHCKQSIYCTLLTNSPIDLAGALQWCHNGHDGVWDHQPHDCLLNHLFRRRSKKISKFRVTGFCAGNSPVTSKRASNTENVSIWWRHHGIKYHSSLFLLLYHICVAAMIVFGKVDAFYQGQEQILHPTDTVGCNYWYLPLIPAFDTQVPMWLLQCRVFYQHPVNGTEIFEVNFSFPAQTCHKDQWPAKTGYVRCECTEYCDPFH